MSQILRQSTQVIVVIGPFVDVGDGFTPETGVTLSGADEAELLKANTTTTTDISGATFAAITGCDGWYGLTLTTSHTDTVGALTVMVNDDSVCLPVFARFQVIEEAAYDVMYAASAPGAASPTNITAGTITTATNVTTVNGLAANVITAASIATGAIDADAIADGAIDAGAIANGAIDAATFAAGAIDAAALAADAGTEIGTAVWATAARTLTALDEDSTTLDLDATIRAAVGLASANLDTQLDALPTAAENATAVWGAGTRVLTAIDEDSTTLDLDATIRGAVGLVSANLDTQIGDLPTNAELATALGTADDVVLAAIAALNDFDPATDEVMANIKKVNDVTVTGDGAGTPWGPA